MSRYSRGPVHSCIFSDIYFKTSSWQGFHTDPKSSAEGEAFPNQVKQKPALKKTQTLGLVVVQSRVYLARLTAESSLLVQNRSRLSKIYSVL